MNALRRLWSSGTAACRPSLRHYQDRPSAVIARSDSGVAIQSGLGFSFRSCWIAAAAGAASQRP